MWFGANLDVGVLLALTGILFVDPLYIGKAEGQSLHVVTP